VVDDVVQLRGDAGPLTAHRQLGEQLPLGVELAPALGQLLRGLAPQLQRGVGGETRQRQDDQSDAGTRRRVLHVSCTARELPQQVSQKDLMDEETAARLTPGTRHLLDV
jgi:hypothetical protein